MIPRSSKVFGRGKNDKISNPKYTRLLIETQCIDSYDDATLHQNAELPLISKYSDMSKDAHPQKNASVPFKNSKNPLPTSRIPVLNTGLNSRSRAVHNLNEVSKKVKFDSKNNIIDRFNSNECRGDKYDITNMHPAIKKPGNLKKMYFTQRNITENVSSFMSKVNCAPKTGLLVKTTPESKKILETKKTPESKKTLEAKKTPESQMDHEYKAISTSKKRVLSLESRTPSVSKTDSKEKKKQQEIKTSVSQTILPNRSTITKISSRSNLKPNIRGWSKTKGIGSLENIPSSLHLSKGKKDKHKTLSVNDLSKIGEEIDFHIKTGQRWIKAPALNVPISKNGNKRTNNLNNLNEETIQYEEHNFENAIPILKKVYQDDKMLHDNSQKQPPKITDEKIFNGKDDVFLLNSPSARNTSSAQVTEIIPQIHVSCISPDSQLVEIVSDSQDSNIEMNEQFSKSVLDSEIARITPVSQVTVSESQGPVPESQTAEIVSDNQLNTPGSQYAEIVRASRVNEITLKRAVAEITPDSQVVRNIQGIEFSNTVTGIHDTSIIPNIHLADSAAGSQKLPYSKVTEVAPNSQVDEIGTDKIVAGNVEDNIESFCPQNKIVPKECLESSKIKFECLPMGTYMTPEKPDISTISCIPEMITEKNIKQVKEDTVHISTKKIKRLSTPTKNEALAKLSTKALLEKVLIGKPLMEGEKKLRILTHQILKDISDMSSGTSSLKKKNKLKHSSSADKYFSEIATHFKNGNTNCDEKNHINEKSSTEESNNSSNISCITNDKEQNAFQTTTFAGSPISKISPESHVQAIKQLPTFSKIPRIFYSSKKPQCPVIIPLDLDLKTKLSEEGSGKAISESSRGLKKCRDAENGYFFIKAFSDKVKEDNIAPFERNIILENADEQVETKYNTESDPDSNVNKSFTFVHTAKNYIGGYNDITDGETQRGNQNFGMSVQLAGSCQKLEEDKQTNKKQMYNERGVYQCCSSREGKLPDSKETEKLVKKNPQRSSTSRKLLITSFSLLIICIMFLYALSCS